MYVFDWPSSDTTLIALFRSCACSYLKFVLKFVEVRTSRCQYVHSVNPTHSSEHACATRCYCRAVADEVAFVCLVAVPDFFRGDPWPDPKVWTLPQPSVVCGHVTQQICFAHLRIRLDFIQCCKVCRARFLTGGNSWLETLG
jgi:hypothetical protein